MSVFGNLFGEDPGPARLPPPDFQLKWDPSRDPTFIRQFDSYGREIFILRQEWCEKLLPAKIKELWDQPEELHSLVMTALKDGFRPQVIDAAKRVYETIDPARGTFIWGKVLLEEGRVDEVEKILRDYLTRHGENGMILTLLAEVYASRSDYTQFEQIIWHALEVDPNQLWGVFLYAKFHRDSSGYSTGQNALRRVAALPGSWRAQISLARSALESRQLDQALDLYREILSRVDKPVPADVLAEISGALVDLGHLPETLAIVEPHFDAAIHGFEVGKSLIKAHIDLGQPDSAQQILDQLYSLNRPEWKSPLRLLNDEIIAFRLFSNVRKDEAHRQAMMLWFVGPIWLKPHSPAAELFPVRPDGNLAISFLGGSTDAALVGPQNGEYVVQRSSEPTLLCRALPFFLAEQIEFTTTARVKTLVAYSAVEGGSVLMRRNRAFSDGLAANYARCGELPCDYVLVSHLKTRAKPWVTEFRLIRTIDEKCVAELSVAFSAGEPGGALADLVRRVQKILISETGIETFPSPPEYAIPGELHVATYLGLLERLLTYRCIAALDSPDRTSGGKREFIDAAIDLCLKYPATVSIRILLAETVLTVSQIRADIVSEFRDKLALLQMEKPLAEPSHSVVQRMIHEAIGRGI